MAHRLVFTASARRELLGLYLYIAERSGEERARSYVDRIQAYCDGLRDFPKRGTRRDDIKPGLRLLGFQRRVVIAFHIRPNEVVIDRILYGGRDLGELDEAP